MTAVVLGAAAIALGAGLVFEVSPMILMPWLVTCSVLVHHALLDKQNLRALSKEKHEYALTRDAANIS